MQLAIIPPCVEEELLSDFVVRHQMPLHLAALIALVALFIIAWVVLSETPQARRRWDLPKNRSISTRPVGRQ